MFVCWVTLLTTKMLACNMFLSGRSTLSHISSNIYCDLLSVRWKLFTSFVGELDFKMQRYEVKEERIKKSKIIFWLLWEKVRDDFLVKLKYFSRVSKSIYLNQICSIIFYNILPFLGQSHSIAIELLWFLIEKLLQVIFTGLFWS